MVCWYVGVPLDAAAAWCGVVWGGRCGLGWWSGGDLDVYCFCSGNLFYLNIPIKQFVMYHRRKNMTE